MFDSLMESFKYMDDATKQGIVFAVGIAVYYLLKKLFVRNDRY